MLNINFLFRRKKALVFCAASLTVIFLLTELPVQSRQQELADTVLRFHVLAASNTPQDQAIKLQVRDAVLEAMAPLLKDVSTKEEVMETVNLHHQELLCAAETALTEAGCSHTVSLTLENCYFPAKTYGELCFPPGYYDAVRVQIGAAEGRNWWCVMYPMLCFTDLTGGVLPDTSQSQLEKVLSDDTIQSMYPVRFRFRIFTFLNRFLEP